MIVYCNNGFSPDISEKEKLIMTLKEGMIYYFQNLNFGESIREVVYYVKCGDSIFVLNFGLGITYSKRNKNIGCGFLLDYEIVQSLNGEPLCNYFIKQIIEETEKISQYNIKKFDLGAYIKNLREYFEQAIELIKLGKRPADGKEINNDIQQAMFRKFTKL